MEFFIKSFWGLKPPKKISIRKIQGAHFALNQKSISYKLCPLLLPSICINWIFDLGLNKVPDFFYHDFSLFFEEKGKLQSMGKWWNFTKSQYFVLCCLSLDSLLHFYPEKPSDSYSKPILKKGLISSFCHYNVYGTLNLVLQGLHSRTLSGP